MTTFPAIKPTSRVWSPGARAQSIYQSLDGVEIRFVHGDLVTGQNLSLTFANVTDAVGQSITDHYSANGTTYGTFDLPGDVFAGMSNYSYTNESSNAWRYAAPPDVSFPRPGYQTISIRLLGVAA